MTDILAIGDLHLGRLATLFKTWRKWSFAPMWQAVQYAASHNIQHILQLGDVFDEPNPSQELLIQLIRFLKKVEDRYPELHLHFVLGNHDKLDRKRNSLILLRYLSHKYHLKNCHIYIKPTRLQLASIPVVFLPWPIYKSPLLAGAAALVVAHVERKGAKYDSGRVVTDHAFSLGKHFWLVGHLHEPQVYKNLVYAGALLQLRHGDNAEKFLWHLRVQAKPQRLVCKIKQIPVKLPFTLQTIRINKLAEHAWLRQFRQLKPNAYVRLLIHSDVALPQKYLTHPRVLRTEYFGNKTARTVLSEMPFATQQQDSVQQRLLALELYLGKEGLRKPRIKRALQLAQRLENTQAPAEAGR